RSRGSNRQRELPAFSRRTQSLVRSLRTDHYQEESNAGSEESSVRNRTVKSGAKAVLPCGMSSSSHNEEDKKKETVTWIRRQGSEALAALSQPNANMLNDQSMLKKNRVTSRVKTQSQDDAGDNANPRFLVLENVSKSDEGLYTCIVVGPNGQKRESSSTWLQVQVDPPSRSLVDEAREVEEEEARRSLSPDTYKEDDNGENEMEGDEERDDEGAEEDRASHSLSPHVHQNPWNGGGSPFTPGTLNPLRSLSPPVFLKKDKMLRTIVKPAGNMLRLKCPTDDIC
ncbi:hypothetical protein J437_LFUL011951, partial [Ladona fulva]